MGNFEGANEIVKKLVVPIEASDVRDKILLNHCSVRYTTEILQQKYKSSRTLSPLSKLRYRNRQRAKKLTTKKKPIFKADVAKFVDVRQINGTGYNVELRLDFDRIMAVRQGHFNYKRQPKIEVRDNKTFEYRESFSGFCGRPYTLKNWLYYT